MESFNSKRPYTFDRVTRLVITLGVLVIVYLLLKHLSGVLLPFFVALIIAYMLEPIVQWNMRWMHSKRRFLPVVFTLVEATVAFGIFCAVFIPYIISETSQMGEMLKKYATTEMHIPYLSKDVHDWIRDNINLSEITKYLSKEELTNLIKGAISNSWSFLSSGIALIVGFASWLIVALYVIFIMLDYERLVLSFRQLVPYNHRRRVFALFDDVKTAMNSYFRGQGLVALCVGILSAIGFIIVGLPMGALVGLLVGLLTMVPYLKVVTLPISVLLCLVASVQSGTNFWPLFWETMVVYVIVQTLEDMVLVPKIMGKFMGLNPAIILLSLSIWGSLLGFIGLIIALPLTTILLSYYNRYIIEKNAANADETMITEDISSAEEH